jgi:hypothetical protein
MDINPYSLGCSAGIWQLYRFIKICRSMMISHMRMTHQFGGFMTITIRYPMIFALTLGVMAGGLYALPSHAQDQAAPVEASDSGAAAAPAPAPAPPSDLAGGMAGAPEAPPKATGPVYNPPPPSGKDWGKLPQATREQILNDWKALPEKDREPFIFYRERAMAKLPDSAYSDNPYKPENPEAAAARAAGTAAAPVPAAAQTEEKSGGFLDKLFNKDKEQTAQ